MDKSELEVIDLGDAKEVTQGPFLPERIEDNVSAPYQFEA